MICSAYQHSFFTSRGVGLVSCRAGNVIGGGDWAQDRIIPDAVRAISQGRALGVRNPCSVRPWQHVLEPLFGYLILGARMLENKDGCEGSCQPFAGPWNFGPPTDSCRPVSELVSAFFDAYGSGSWEDVSSGQTDAPREAHFLALNWDKAYRHLGWHPRWDLSESVKRTSLWYRQQAAGADAERICMDDIKAYTGEE
jgi:CDP-glucose 4,6-dehydratase